MRRFRALRAGGLLAWALFALAGRAGATGLPDDLSVGGSLSLTSDYIYRGLAESDGHGAAQADVHLDSGSGTYLGVWASTRDRQLPPGAADELEAYLGQRLQLSSTWSASVDGRAHYYVAGTPYTSFDYQEVAAKVTYLDRWSFSVTAIPNAVRYWYSERLSRAPAWVADTSGQWLLDRRPVRDRRRRLLLRERPQHGTAPGRLRGAPGALRSRGLRLRKRGAGLTNFAAGGSRWAIS